MSDLHLSLGTDKPMDVFGSAWHNYTERIIAEWNSLVGENDTVLVGGDISWAMNISECTEDFKYINDLKGTKILLKGNHDYWWDGISKMNNFLADNEFNTIKFLQNNAFLVEDVLVCGSRGWLLPGDGAFSADERKIYERELQRLELSLDFGDKLLKSEGASVRKKICLLHYPPFTKDHVADEGIMSVMEKHGVTDCVYGHLHAAATKNAVEGVHGFAVFKLASADYLKFCPYRL